MTTDMQGEVRIERNLLIPLEDGAVLAANLCMPLEGGPFPTLINCYPYHKDDAFGALNDWPVRYFAARGYASLFVDYRGLGGSSGKAWETMDPGQGRDAAEAVEWAAAQPWCDGNVGMWGLSAGAYTSLKAAAEKPPHLKAIAPIQGGLDIYHDYFFSGGCHDCLFSYGTWGSWMIAMSLMPPTYLDPEGRWYKMWLERLEQSEPWMLPWPNHREYDEYWRSKAVAVESIQVPTLMIGGWRDMFPETVPRLYEQLKCPKRLLMGPWMHTLPDLSPFEPVDYLHEMCRWFDRWLKREQNGVDTDPPVVIFVQGRNEWRQEHQWPTSGVVDTEWFLQPSRGLARSSAAKNESIRYTAVPSIGATTGRDWDPSFLDIGLPGDQGPDDLRSVTFTSEPLEDDLEISGSPRAVLRVTLESGSELQLVARLCDVDPQGASALVTRGWLNAVSATAGGAAALLQNDKALDLGVLLSATRYVIPRGHRIRLSVACSDFPRMWPMRTNPTIALWCGGKDGPRITIPTLPRRDVEDQVVEMRRPPTGVDRTSWVAGVTPRLSFEQDLVTGTTSVTSGFWERLVLPQGGVMEVDQRSTARVADANPEGASVDGDTLIRLDLPAFGRVEVITASRTFQAGMAISAQITVNGCEFFAKRWTQ